MQAQTDAENGLSQSRDQFDKSGLPESLHRVGRGADTRQYDMARIRDEVRVCGQFSGDAESGQCKLQRRDVCTAAIDDCEAAGLPLPPLCEILDFDRDNDVDKDDAALFYQCCYTGGWSGPSGGGGSSPLLGMVDWTQGVMSQAERSQHADSVIQASLSVGEAEATVLQNFANSIDPQ